jgi:hypothetical protein
MNLVYSNNRNDVDVCDYVKIKDGTVHCVVSLDKDRVCIQTIKGDVWILKENIIEVNPHLNFDFLKN